MWRTSRVSGENKDGPRVPAQGGGRASRRQLLVQTYGLQGAPEGVQAKGWHGPVSSGKLGAVLRWTRPAGTGWVIALGAAISVCMREVVWFYRIIRTC